MSNNNRHEIFERAFPCWWSASYLPSAWGLVEITPLFFQKQTTEPVEASSPIPLCKWKGATSSSAKAAPSATAR